MCTTRCSPKSSCPPATRFRNEKNRPHPSRPPETAKDRWTRCPRRLSLHIAPCLHPQTGPVAQSSTNDISTRGQEGRSGSSASTYRRAQLGGTEFFRFKVLSPLHLHIMHTWRASCSAEDLRNLVFFAGLGRLLLSFSSESDTIHTPGF